MTGQTRRKPSVRALAPQRTAATHASGADEFSYRFVRRQNYGELLSVADRVEAAGIPPMSVEELNAEIQSCRAECRRAGV